jgi:hypothetical protein
MNFIRSSNGPAPMTPRSDFRPPPRSRRRWHDVLKTAYFVLDTVNCDLPIKKKLEESLDRMLSIMRKRSLCKPGES